MKQDETTGVTAVTAGEECTFILFPCHFRSHQPLFPVKYEFDVSRSEKGLCSTTGIQLLPGTCQFDMLRSDLNEDEVSWTHLSVLHAATHKHQQLSCPCGDQHRSTIDS